MRSKPAPIPLKWYVASFMGALVLALALMTVFELRAQDEPNFSLRHQERTSEATIQQARLSESPPPPPPSEPLQTKPYLSKSEKHDAKSLWDNLVTAQVVAISAALAGLGAAFLVGTVVSWKKRRAT